MPSRTFVLIHQQSFPRLSWSWFAQPYPSKHMTVYSKLRMPTKYRRESMIRIAKGKSTDLMRGLTAKELGNSSIRNLCTRRERKCPGQNFRAEDNHNPKSQTESEAESDAHRLGQERIQRMGKRESSSPRGASSTPTYASSL
jgi:hypothetical protein